MATKNLIVVSDTHCGCRVGLLHPDGITVDGGGLYLPSEFQKKMWAWWEEFWGEWVPKVTRGEPFDLVHNGDAIDGVHHGSTTQISHNIQDQLRIAEAVLRPVVEQCKASGGTYYHIRGTEAHVGKSGEYEERLAATLGAKPNHVGQCARNDLWKRVGDTSSAVHAPLVHLLHHIGTTSSEARESSAVNAELAAAYVEAGRWNREPPDFVVRSHRHRSIKVTLPARHGQAAAITTPAWQGKTPWVYRVPGARLSEPQIGGILIRQGEDVFYTQEWVKSFERSPEE